MHSGKILSLAFMLLALLSPGCNKAGGGGGGSNSILGIEQDLTLDPAGTTTVVTFMSDPGVLTPANFEADGGQNAVSVNQNGNAYEVTWDARVTPAHQVRPLAVGSIPETFMAVSTSDAAAPTFAVTAANQVVGLGNDTITVQFSGARVIESEAEDLANWTLKIGSTTLPLTGSTFSLDNNTQVLSVTTGSQANLHASFTLAAKNTLHSVADVALATTAVAGNASGDNLAPTLSSVVQNLTEDEFGRVVDLTFSEAMDPLFCASLANFGGANPDVATTFAQPSANVLRVTFNNPIVPGVNTIDLADLVDAHGNAFPDQNVAVAAGSTVANGFDNGPDVTTVEGVGGDVLTVDFLQAIDPDDASDPAHWNLEIPTGNPIDLSNCTLTYDLPTKALSIELDFDALNGDSFTFEPASGNEPVDVDGELFSASVAGLVTGDGALPTLSGATQNRVFDPTGMTVDVVFSEALEETSAETLGNWNIPGKSLQTATLLPSKSVVRLVWDAYVLPGTDTLDASGILDLAGNSMTAVLAQALTSTDTTAPGATSITAQAVEGEANDVVRVTFNDNLIESEIENVANWTFESPVGSAQSLAGASVVWNDAGRQASVTLPAGIDLVGGNSARASFSGVHDIAGNAITATAASGTVAAEVNVPTVDSVWVKTGLANHVVVRFSEPCAEMDDISGLTQYVVRNSSGVIKGAATSATEAVDHMGVELVFGFAVLAGSDTLDLAGVTDLAGNSMFPVSQHAVAVEDGTSVDLDTVNSNLTSVAGEANDTIELVFTTPPSRWNLLSVSNYTISLLGTPLNLNGATLSYDGNLTVTIALGASGSPNLQTGATYDVDISALTSVQGVAGAAISESIAAGGESVPPSLPAGLTRLDASSPTDSVLIQFSEAVDLASAENTAHYDLNGGANPDSVTRVGLSTVRAVWNGGVVLGDTVNASVADLAGNVGVVSRAVSAADLQGPLVVSVDGLSVSGAGLDTVTVVFDKPVDPTSALDPSNYGVTNGSALVIGGSILTFDSSTNSVTIHLQPGVELDPTLGLTVHVQDVGDHAGLVMNPPANVGGAVTGDLSAPAFEAAFVNYRADVLGLSVDVRFSEDVPAAFVSNPANWSLNGGQAVQSVTLQSGTHVRLFLDLPLSSGDELELTALPDMAGNESGTISIAPSL